MQRSRYIPVLVLIFFANSFVFGQKLSVATDKGLYLSGEILWFSVQRSVSPEPDNVLYAELIDPSGEPALQAKLEMAPQGVGGSFYLPASLVTGTYKLRTYTRNFTLANGGYAEKQVRLINTIAAPVPPSSAVSDSLSGASDASESSSSDEFDMPPDVVRTFSLKTDADTYGTRKKVELLFADKNLETVNKPALFSVTVYREDSLTQWAQNQGHSTTFPVNATPANAPREKIGQIIQAKVTSRETGEPGPNVGVYLSIPSAPKQLYVGRSTADGTVSFEVDDYYGPGEVFLQPFLDQDTASWQIDLLSPFLLAGTKKAVTDLPIPANMVQTLTRRSIDMQAQNLYWSDSLKKFELPDYIDTLPFYGIPDQTYKLDEYVRFVTMEEVLREYVTSIGVAVKGGLPAMRLFHPEDNLFVDDNLLVMLDGVPVHHYNRLFQYDPLKVKRLEIVQSMYIYGYQFLKGIIHFITYDHIYNGYELEPSVFARNYDGLQLKRNFFSPDYSAGAAALSSKPDLRNTLYWSPAAQLSNGHAVQFYTADQKGRYRVEVRGMTEDGEEWLGTTSFEVK